MLCRPNRIQLLAFLCAFGGSLFGASIARSSDIHFVGGTSYTIMGNDVVLTADRIVNFSASGVSGTLRLELWAYPTPFNGSSQAGYRLAEHLLGTIDAGYGFQNIDSGAIPFTLPPNGTWVVTMMVSEYDGSPGNNGYTPIDYLNFSDPLVVAQPGAATKVAIEYHHAGFDHYFITPVEAEVALLDAHAPPFQEWSRTGFTFKVYAPATAPVGSVATCRFFNTSFAPKSSHFYAPHGFGCEATLAQFPDWGLEDDKLFYTMLPAADGTCPTGTIPVYRLYNNGMGSAPNHRFVTSLAERQNMIDKGYVAEGNGIGVGMCVPP